MNALFRLAWQSAWNRRFTLALTMFSIALSTFMLLGVERICRALRSQSPLTTAQRHVRDGNREKLEGLLPGAVDRLWEAGAADFVVCEADGARHKPLKAWADWEPPIPGRTTVLCAVLGADRLDKPLTEAHVHRMDRMTEDFGFRPGDPLTPERLAALLESPRGYLKNAPLHVRVE